MDILLALGVSCTWLAVFAAARMSRALDRLHALAFAYVAALGFVLAAALVQEGFTDRTLKFAFLYLVQLLAGGAATHALARGLAVRDGRDLS